MLYTQQQAKANVRNRDGKRVFILGAGDRLTPGARDWLQQERIEIRTAGEGKIETYRLPGGGFMTEKPEHMTHLHGDVLVHKTHPRIAFRGAVDALEAEIVLCQLKVPSFRKELGELLEQTRLLIRWEVMDEPVKQGKLCGLTEEEIRRRSHFPQDFYGQTHFMPEYTDGEAVVYLNRLRCAVRSAELAAARAFTDEEGCCTREDLLKALNRMSSMVYIFMIRLKAGK